MDKRTTRGALTAARRAGGGSPGHDFSTCDRLTAQCEHLAAYEDSGLTPERAAELGKADAQGRVVVLPCKVGDKVYAHDYGWVKGFVVNHVIVENGSACISAECEDECEDCCCGDDACCAIKFSTETMAERNIYLTREEAEAALGYADESDARRSMQRGKS